METAQGEPGSTAPPWGAMHPSQRPTPQAISGRGFVCGASSAEVSSPLPLPSAISAHPRSRILPSQHLPWPWPSYSWVWPADTPWPSLGSLRAWACPHRQAGVTLADTGHSGSAPTLDFKLPSCWDQVGLPRLHPSSTLHEHLDTGCHVSVYKSSLRVPATQLRELDRHWRNDGNGEPS